MQVTSLPILFADEGGAIAAIVSLFMFVVWLGFVGAILAGLWKTFEKAGKPGWAGIVPIYNMIVLCEIVGKPVWWGLLAIFAPCVNVVFSVLLMIELAKKFGKDPLYGIGLALLPFVFFPMLGFGSARYQG